MTYRIQALPPAPEDAYEPPSISTPGRMLVRLELAEYWSVYRYHVEVLDYDPDSCIFWIGEGVGAEFWFDQYVDLELPGVYVLEGVVGEFIRGDGWHTDDDEDWDYDLCRRATPEEEYAECLNPA